MKMIRRNPILQTFVLGLLLPTFAWLPCSVQSNPHDGIVIDGHFDFAEDGDTLMIEQFSNRGIIEWESFSIDSGQSTLFNQPGSSSAVLNRVTGGSVSQIDGLLQANGSVWVINQNGVIIGDSGQIDAFGFLASTLDVSNDAFMRGGDVTLAGSSTAMVQSFGTINAAGGDVVFAGRRVENHGVIGAVDGFVGLAGGNNVLYKSHGEQRIFISAGENSSVLNTGTITSAAAELRAHGNVGALAVQNEGVVRANGAQNINGKIVLSANQGNILNNGVLSAQNLDGSGGSIEIRTGMGEIQINNLVNASGVAGAGGSVTLIGDMVNVGAAAQVRADGQTDGGAIQMTATQNAEVGPGARVSANGATGKGGQIDVRAGEIVFYGDSTVMANGEGGGGGANIVATTGSAVVMGDIEVIGGTGDGGTAVVQAADDVLIEPTGGVNVDGGNNGGNARLSAGDTLIVAGSVSGRGSEGSGGRLVFTGEDVLVNQSGVVDASGASGGQISFSANNELFIAGQVAARGSDGAGGTVTLRGEDVIVAVTGVIDASGSNGGGSVDVRANDTATIHGQILATGGDGAGGTVTVNATDILVSPTALIDTGGATGGTVNIAATDQATVNGVIRSIGSDGAGGTIAVTGDEVTIGATAVIDAGGATGGGNIILGGGFQGNDSRYRNATKTTVAAGAQIRANAGNSGNGGNIVVWADHATDFNGTIESKGAAGGVGGLAEVSGKSNLTFNGNVTAGNLLLDPTDITIDAAMATALRATLENGTNTIIHTNFGAGGSGSISIANDLRYGADAHLALFAQGGIIANASLKNHGAGNITLGAGWTPGGAGLLLGPGAGSDGVVNAPAAPPELDFATINGGAFGTFGAVGGDISVGSQTREVEIGSAAGETNLIGDNITLSAPGAREDQTQIGYRRTRRFVNDGAFAQDFSNREVEVSGNINIEAAGNVVLQPEQTGNPARQPVIVGHGGQSFGHWAQDRETLTGKGDSFNSAAVWKDYVVLGYIDNSQIAGQGNLGTLGANVGANVGVIAAGFDGDLRDSINDGTVGGDAGDLAFQGDTLLTAQRAQEWSGDITVNAGGSVIVGAGRDDSFATIGHVYHGEHVNDGSNINNIRYAGGMLLANMEGDINVTANGVVALVAGRNGDSRAVIGHGGRNVRGVFAGDINVSGDTGVVVRANTINGGGGLDYAQIGHGGFLTRHHLALPGLPGSANNAGIQRIQVNNDGNTGYGGAFDLPANHAVHIDFAFGNHDSDGGNVGGAFGAANTSNANFVSLYDPDGDGVIDVLPASGAFNPGGGVNPGRNFLTGTNPGGFTNARQAGAGSIGVTNENQFDGGRDAGDPINRTPDAITVNGTTILAAGDQYGNSGDITVTSANGSVTTESGINTRDWALIGHGGDESAGSHTGDITVTASGSVSMLHDNTRVDTATGSRILNNSWSNGERSFNQIGHGGFWSTGSHSGDITVNAGDNFRIEAGGMRGWAQVGHGGWENDDGNRSAQGTMSGNIDLNIGGDAVGRGGWYGVENWVQVGHGGMRVEALSFEGHNGNISLDAGGTVDFFAASDLGSSRTEAVSRWAMIGHGGTNSRGDHWGDIHVAGGNGVYMVAAAGYDGWNNDTDNDNGGNQQNTNFLVNGRIQPGYGRNDDRSRRNAFNRTWTDGGYAQIGHGGRDAGHVDSHSGSDAVGFGVLGRMADHNSNLADGNTAILAAGDAGYVASDINIYAGVDPTTGAVTNANANFALIGPNHGEMLSQGAIDRIHTNTNLPTLQDLLRNIMTQHGTVNLSGAPNYILNQVDISLQNHAGTMNQVVTNEFRDQGFRSLGVLPAGFDPLDPTTWTAANLNLLSGGVIDEFTANAGGGGRIAFSQGGGMVAMFNNRMIIDGFTSNSTVQDSNAGARDGNILTDMNGHAIDLNGDDVADVAIIHFPDPPEGHFLHGVVDAANVAAGAVGVGDVRLGTPLPYANSASAQVGHGGRDTRLDDINHRTAWTTAVAAANGGTFAGGGNIGDINIEAGGSALILGSDLETGLSGEVNSGGNNGETNINHRHGGENPSAHWEQATVADNYVQVGHGGRSASGAHSGNINISSGLDLIVTNGTGLRDYTIIGHGGWDNDRGQGALQNAPAGAAPATLDGDITLTATLGNVVISGDQEQYVTGNRSTADNGFDGGHNNLVAGLPIELQPGGELFNSGAPNPFSPFLAGAATGHLDSWVGRNRGIAFIDPTLPVGYGAGQRYNAANLRPFDGRFDIGAQGGGTDGGGEVARYNPVQVGHGGLNTDHDTFRGNIDITAGGGIDVLGGHSLGESFALVGHGGFGSRNESTIGDITLTSGTNAAAADGDINIIGGDGRRAFAMVGHGGWDNDNPNNDNAVSERFTSGHISITAGVNTTDWSVINANSSVNIHGGNGDYFSEWQQQRHFNGTPQRHVAGLGNSGLADANTIVGVGADNDGSNGREIRDWTGNAGSGQAWAQIGHNGRSTRGSAAGNIDVYAANEVNVIGGDGFTSRRNVDGQSQSGAGGGNNSFQNHDILFQENSGNDAHIGHGGHDSDGRLYGNITVEAYNDITVRAGAFKLSQAQVGHGSTDIQTWGGPEVNDVTFHGDVTVKSYTGDVTVEGSTGLERNGFDYNEHASSLQMTRYLGWPAQTDHTYAMIGHGGMTNLAGARAGTTNNEAGVRIFGVDSFITDFVPVRGEATGHFSVSDLTGGGRLTTDIHVTAGNNLYLLGGTVERDAYAQIGHGGLDSRAEEVNGVAGYEGDIEVIVGNDLFVQRGTHRDRAGANALGSLAGNAAFAGDTTMTLALATAGAGGNPIAQGDFYENTRGVAGIIGSQFLINNAYAKIGHGQQRYTGNPHRNHTISNSFGNGSNRNDGRGTWSGDITVAVGHDANFAGGLVGHKDIRTANVGSGDVIADVGNTTIGVGRIDATGNDGILTADSDTVFAAGLDDVTNAMRIYAPTRANLAISPAVSINGSIYPGVPALADPQRGDEYVPYPDFTFTPGMHGEATGSYLHEHPYPIVNGAGNFYAVYHADLTTLVPGASPFVPGGPVLPPVLPGGGGDELPAREEEEEIVLEVLAQLPVVEPETVPVEIPFDPTPLLRPIFELNGPSNELFDETGTLDEPPNPGDTSSQLSDTAMGDTRGYGDLVGGSVEYDQIPVSGIAGTGSPYSSGAVTGDTFSPGIPNLVSDGSSGNVSVELIVNPVGLPPGARPVVADRILGIYYEVGTPEALSISSENREEFPTGAAAEAAGYQPANSEEDEGEDENEGGDGFGSFIEGGGVNTDAGDDGGLFGDPPAGDPAMSENPFEN